MWETGNGVLELPDGRRVRGRGLRTSFEEVDPEFGIYLQDRDPRIDTWPNRWVHWPDFGLPDSTQDAVAALREAHDRAVSERVEVACGAGIGRTGTALSVLAIMSGVDAEDAVAWVREHYHRRAVETRQQHRWVSEVAASLTN
ncbi:protein-tyrosine phosphatase family protein [uncultured Agrococcus sp.]|uniref:protein-tyrosine phosphatase family protein n=1 Tax=uncultured Agrococcus sp. TaxID=382258 RepID=UPI0025E63515|nr:protein-tyrosine phosphatase family protein [uncultured Agrococcus sp.]